MDQGDSYFVNSLDDLFEYVVTEAHLKFPPDQVIVGEGFVIKIRLVGEQWQGGYLDYRLANYIIKLQRDLLSVYNDITGEHVTGRSPRHVIKPLTVRVKVEEGSSLINIDLSNSLSSMLQHMTSEQLVIIAGLTVLGWVGYKVFSKWADLQKEIKIKRIEAQRDAELGKIDSETAKVREETLQKAQEESAVALELAKSAQESTRYLINALDPGDRYVVDNVALSKREAIELLPPKETYEPRQPKVYQVDGSFSVLLQDLRTFAVKVQAEGRTFSADTMMLDEGDKKALQAEFAEASIHQEVPEIRLRLALRVDPETDQIIDGSLLKLNPAADDGTRSFADFIAARGGAGGNPDQN